MVEHTAEDDLVEAHAPRDWVAAEAQDMDLHPPRPARAGAGGYSGGIFCVGASAEAASRSGVEDQFWADSAG